MERLVNLCDKIAFFLISFMMLTVLVSVLGRLIFDLTNGDLNLVLPGSIELVSYAMLFMIFTAMPRALINGPVKVDLLVAKLPAPIRTALARLWNALLAAFFAILCVLFTNKAITMFYRGDVTLDLRVPLYLIYGAVALACICIVLTCIWLVISPRHDQHLNEM